MKGEKSGEDIAARGPTVVDVRSNPKTIELTGSSQPQAEVLADVKDFNVKVSDVRLRFLHVPLELPMEHVEGSTWRAKLSRNQLERLAVSGQTTKYEANVIARNTKGEITVSEKPVTIAIKAPQAVRPVG